MTLRFVWPALTALLLLSGTAGAQNAGPSAANPYARDPKQTIDEAYTKKIKEYTTAPYFTSPLVDYLPASKTVPTPMAVLKDVAGAPGILPYSAEVYQYMRMVEKASPRVKVFSIGKTEEGREMIAVAVSSEANLARLEQNKATLAKLADPRRINLDDAEADRLVGSATPIYYITGTIHSPETGAPTALMELVYRLAVDESPYIQKIRNRLVTLITPIVEVDGRDRQVDVYRWHLANPGKNWPGTLYWGKYVAHDNNRDAMGLTLALTRNVLNTYVDWHAQVLHDLHESVPYLYDNTVGDGPYNAWIDPILASEWQMIGWYNVNEMTKFGMRGVFTHGTFDTWSPGYLMFIAAMHNGISRLYETFGNAGADTVDRTLRPSETSRTWYRQNPPLPKTRWSQRNNNNYEETGLLVSLDQFADNAQYFLKNFYLKAKRSVQKPKTEGPAAYVFPADDPRPGAQADLLRILQLQKVEISRAKQAFTAVVPGKRRPARQLTNDPPARSGGPAADGQQDQSGPQDESRSDANRRRTETVMESRTFPAGSFIVRMDQPFSRIADALLDYQYWAPDDPQKQPYDDTGWTFPELFDVQTARVTDTKVLDVPMDAVAGEVKADSGVTGSGSIFLVNNNTDPSLITLRYRLKDAHVDVAEDGFDANGQRFNRGSFIIRDSKPDEIAKAAADLGLKATGVASAPTVKTHPARAARIALVHTWLSTQDEGWWRQALDLRGVPFSYISTQALAKDADLRSKYDVLLFPPVGRASTQAVVHGTPMYGNPIPWKTTELTPNIGKEDSTEDIRPGMGWDGVMHLQTFVREGGVLIAVDDTAQLVTELGLAPGVSTTQSQRLKVVGSVLRSKLVDGASPIAYGYDDDLSIYADNPPLFGLSAIVGGRTTRRPAENTPQRATGRGTPDDPDVAQGFARTLTPPEEPRVEAWQYAPIQEEQRRNAPNIIPPAQRPRVILRYADARDLLVSGLLDGGSDLAQRAMVVDVPVEKGHIVLFSNNPIWRGETQGSYALVFNTILNFDTLDAGRKLDEK